MVGVFEECDRDLLFCCSGKNQLHLIEWHNSILQCISVEAIIDFSLKPCYYVNKKLNI